MSRHANLKHIIDDEIYNDYGDDGYGDYGDEYYPEVGDEEMQQALEESKKEAKKAKKKKSKKNEVDPGVLASLVDMYCSHFSEVQVKDTLIANGMDVDATKESLNLRKKKAEKSGKGNVKKEVYEK